MMYKGLGQECSKGVLQLMEMETVLAFWSDSKMMATMHWLAVAMVWHDSPYCAPYLAPMYQAGMGLHSCK